MRLYQLRVNLEGGNLTHDRHVALTPLAWTVFNIIVYSLLHNLGSYKLKSLAIEKS